MELGRLALDHNDTETAQSCVNMMKENTHLKPVGQISEMYADMHACLVLKPTWNFKKHKYKIPHFQTNTALLFCRMRASRMNLNSFNANS